MHTLVQKALHIELASQWEIVTSVVLLWTEMQRLVSVWSNSTFWNIKTPKKQKKYTLFLFFSTTTLLENNILLLFGGEKKDFKIRN